PDGGRRPARLRRGSEGSILSGMGAEGKQNPEPGQCRRPLRANEAEARSLAQILGALPSLGAREVLRLPLGRAIERVPSSPVHCLLRAPVVQPLGYGASLAQRNPTSGRASFGFSPRTPAQRSERAGVMNDPPLRRRNSAGRS